MLSCKRGTLYFCRKCSNHKGKAHSFEYNCFLYNGEDKSKNKTYQPVNNNLVHILYKKMKISIVSNPEDMQGILLNNSRNVHLEEYI